ncbi:MAG: MTH1187 family thiamine-binding protein [Candidatus Krumholzibacteriota bacterium]|nr:MTH1187 family thiamine-binding protein [Candidatus Krumholzibacteriota bacterium]
MLASFSIVPVGIGANLGNEVAQIISIIDESGLEYRMGPMETTVEGEFDDLIRLITRCHHHMKGLAPRVLTTIRIDDFDSGQGRLHGKIADVEKILGRQVRK